MSRFTSLYLRAPRPKNLFGFLSLQTGMEMITTFLLFNLVVTSLGGLLALVTGFPLSTLQQSMYLYSITLLVAVLCLMPHIWRNSVVECLALTWIFIGDTMINMLASLAFGMEWWFISGSTKPDGGSNNDNTKTDVGMAQDTLASAVLIMVVAALRIYFIFVAMAFSRQVIQRRIQTLVIEGDRTVVDSKDGPFAQVLPDGEGWRGKVGRTLVSFGRGYWLQQADADWTKDPQGPRMDIV